MAWRCFELVFQRSAPDDRRSAITPFLVKNGVKPCAGLAPDAIGDSSHGLGLLKGQQAEVLPVLVGVAVITNLAVTLVDWEPTQVGVVARVVLLGLAALGVLVSLSWDELVETWVVQLMITAIEPPEPPEDR